jgi:hypothetical protein
MSVALMLLAPSAAMGFALGTSFSWGAILISSIALSVISAAALHAAGFGALSAIAITATCLSANQIAYVMAVALADRGSTEAKKSRERHGQAC